MNKTALKLGFWSAIIVAIHYFVQEERKIFSHLSIAFGLMYAIISVANYLIQIITVIPGIENHYLDGLEILAAGNPNSVFFALMASYFFMFIMRNSEFRYANAISGNNMVCLLYGSTN